MAGITITEPNAVALCEKYAKQMDLSPADAAVHLIGVARSRINALRKYAAKHAEDKPAKPAKVEKKIEAKKPEPKPAAKKGPVKAKKPTVKKAAPVNAPVPPGTQPVAQ